MVGWNDTELVGYAAPGASEGSFVSMYNQIAYTGQTFYFILHGLGSLDVPDSPYMGQFTQGRPEGYGVQIKPKQGDTYTGQWKSGQRDGYGELQVGSGDVCKGQFKDGFADGICKFSDKRSGVVYTGEFTRGRWAGFGVGKLDSSAEYHGDWDRSFPKDFTVAVFPTGTIYAGQCKSYAIAGLGTWTYANGTSCMCENVDLKPHGRARFINSDGSVADRIWKDGFETQTPCDMTSLLPLIKQGRA